jgi:Ni,Fe-hydrogenase III component G
LRTYPVREEGGRLVSLWGEDGRNTSGDFRLCVVLETTDRLLVVEQALPLDAPTYPDLSEIFPSAARLQRAAHDLVGLHALGGDDRPWLRHAHSPAPSAARVRSIPRWRQHLPNLSLCPCGRRGRA